MDAVRKTEITKSGEPRGDSYVTVNAAAKAIKKAPATVLSLIVAKELVGERIAGRNVVTRESVQQYKARHGIADEPEDAVTR